jgi:predicted RNA-binding protein with RPS1 domain
VTEAEVPEAEAPEAEAEVTAEAEAPEAEAPEAEAEVTEAETEVTAEAPQSEAAAATAEAAATDTTEAAAATAEAVAAEEPEAAGASFTPVEDEETDDSRPQRMKDLEVGLELDGRVTSIALYGIFVDVGVGRDGLVHISEMSDTRINSPSDMVQIGDTVHVRIKGLDHDARRISLTMRAQRETSDNEERRSRKRPEIDRDTLANYNVGDTVEGTITGLSSFGAFVDIGVGKDGLVHISELAEGRIEKPEDAVQVGETHIFKLLEIDPEGSRISLSLRRAIRAQKMRELEPGQMFEGRVSGLAAFGAFVDIGVGRDGLVHISQLSEDRIEKVEDVVKVGDPVNVRVLEVDPQSKRISLTMRPEPSPEETEEELEANTVPSSTTEDTASSESAQVYTTATANASRERDEQARRESRRQSGGGQRGGRGGRGGARQASQPSSELYTTVEDNDDEFTGNATLEDLVSKFGGSKKEKNRRRGSDNDEDTDEDMDEADIDARKRQRDAIRRTLKRQNADDE